MRSWIIASHLLLALTCGCRTQGEVAHGAAGEPAAKPPACAPGSGAGECAPAEEQGPTSCAAVLCAVNSRCDESTGTARCVPLEPAKCGKTTCDAESFCCNESCGICAPIGGSCTQQFCGEE